MEIFVENNEIYKQKELPINWENRKDGKNTKDHGTTSVEELISTGHQYESAQHDEVDKVGFDVLVKEFNVHKLRDFSRSVQQKLPYRKQYFRSYRMYSCRTGRCGTHSSC